VGEGLRVVLVVEKVSRDKADGHGSVPLETDALST
jgi:hypothetical protein